VVSTTGVQNTLDKQKDEPTNTSNSDQLNTDADTKTMVDISESAT
jgi:hypothetical protein